MQCCQRKTYKDLSAAKRRGILVEFKKKKKNVQDFYDSFSYYQNVKNVGPILFKFLIK